MPGRRSIARPPCPQGPTPGPAAARVRSRPSRLRKRSNGETSGRSNGRPARREAKGAGRRGRGRASLELIPNNPASLVPYIAELERVYAYGNRKLFADLLPPDVVVLAGPRGRARGLRGRFTPACWQGRGNGGPRRAEIFIAADHADTDPLEVCHTVIHAMVHLRNAQRNIVDCNHNGYHNKEFQREAERRGLLAGPWDRKRGYGRTRLAPHTRDLLERDLRPDPEKLALYRLVPERTKAPTLFRRFECECPKSIYAQRDEAGARCDHCGAPYVRMKTRKKRR